MVILKASRPPGWCFGPILFGMGLIQSQAIPKTLLSFFMVAMEILSLSFPLCTILFGINDVYDYDTDIRNPRKSTSGLEGGILLPVHHPSVRLAAYLSTVFILLISFLTFRPQKFLATILLLIFVWQYSAPPLRLKEIPVLDSLSNGFIVLLAWFIGYGFGGGNFYNMPTKSYALALCTTGVHALGATMDVESDVAAGQVTIATFFGQRSGAIFGAISYAAALFIENNLTVFGVYLWGGFAIMLMPCLHVQWSHRFFQIIVYWTVGMSLVWFGSNALSARHRA